MRFLHVTGCSITDRGLSTLAGLDELEAIVLDRTQVTDAATETLVQLPRLEHVSAHDYENDGDRCEDGP